MLSLLLVSWMAQASEPDAASEASEDEVTPTEAQDPAARARLSQRLPRAEFDLRTLRRHAFIQPSRVVSALVTSRVGLSVGMGVGEVRAEQGAEGSDGEEVFSRSDLGVAQALRLGVQGWRRVEFGGHVRGLFLLSQEDADVLRTGAEFDVGGDAGATVKLLRVERTGTQLSFRASFEGAAGIRFLPGVLVERLTARSDDGPSTLAVTDEDRDSLTYRTRRLGGGGALALAQAFAPWVGLQVSVAGAGGSLSDELVVPPESEDGEPRKVDTTGTWGRVESGLALTFDGWPRAPVAAQVEYVWTWNRVRTDLLEMDDHAHGLWGGVFYSGHPFLDLGARVGGALPDGSGLDVQALTAQIVFQGYL